jgi:hypothetical protein
LTILLAGGLLFNSCQKDNDLFNASPTEQSYQKDNYGNPHDSVVVDILNNYPDPFYTHTTIEYRLKKMSWVKLTVYNENSGFGTLLMHEIQQKGVHTYEFDGSGMAEGEYVIELKLSGGQIAIEKMVKEDPPSAEIGEELVPE